MNEAAIKRAAQALVQRWGSGWYDDPMEGGQDAYDICMNTIEEVRRAVSVYQETEGWQPISKIEDNTKFTFDNPILIGWTDEVLSCTVAYWESDTPQYSGRGWTDSWSGMEVEREPDVFMLIPKLPETHQ